MRRRNICKIQQKPSNIINLSNSKKDKASPFHTALLSGRVMRADHSIAAPFPDH